MNNNIWFKKNLTEFINSNYLFVFNGSYNEFVKRDIYFIKKYFSLIVLDERENSFVNFVAKRQLEQELKKNKKKNFRILKNIFIEKTINFGNQIIAMNNLIYYCEILGIKNIYLNSEINWYIKSEIKTEKIQISIISKNKINCNSITTYCCNIATFFFPIIIKSKRRSIILKNEIKKNLPQIKTDKNDLYIYIRSGDSFQIGGNHYPPSPFCFYKKIISNFKFNKIYLISQDDKSPIIRKLLKDYTQIRHKLNSKEVDIAIIMNAYNLVNSVSSFSLDSIAFNDNLIIIIL